jgi:hypothetical protein
MKTKIIAHLQDIDVLLVEDIGKIIPFQTRHY